VTRRLERSVWIIAVLFAAVAVVGWRAAGRRLREDTHGPRRTAIADTTIPGTPTALLAMVAEQVVARDPFRLERRPSAVAFGAQVMPAMAPDPSVRRPRLLLSGVLGPPWQAVLEGIPGREGSVVAKVGDVFGELRIRSIRRDTVVVQGADTTWKLTVRKVW
jgi:hypothetical protein